MAAHSRMAYLVNSEKLCRFDFSLVAGLQLSLRICSSDGLLRSKQFTGSNSSALKKPPRRLSA